MRRRLALPFLLAAALGLQCFPELPDPGLVDSLRVLAVRADPAVAVLDTYPLPSITVTALTVDPSDETLAGVTHTWTLDLPDDVEGVEQLQALVPDPPHGPSIEIDLNALFGGAAGGGAAAAAEDGPEYLTGLLPLRCRAETADDHREAVKLVSFLIPDFSGGDDDDATGDDDDSAAATRAIDPSDPPAGYNENPTLVSLTVNGGVFSAGDGLLPGPTEPMLVGPVAPDVGLRLDLEVSDDKDPADVDADLFWTNGCPGLPPDLSMIPPNQHPDDGECLDDDSFGFGGSARIDETDGGSFGAEGPARAFGWHPPSAGQPARLFLILMDGEGGQTWQEIRTE